MKFLKFLAGGAIGIGAGIAIHEITKPSEKELQELEMLHKKAATITKEDILASLQKR
jgi:hypothetical protein